MSGPFLSTCYFFANLGHGDGLCVGWFKSQKRGKGETLPAGLLRVGSIGWL
jgi:hypothetical protein